MAEAKGGDETREIEHISTQINGCPRDLLQRFKASNQHHHHSSEFVATEDNEEIELNLGLSLGGCFGVNPREKKKNRLLVRSSSIAGLTTLRRDDDDDDANGAHPPVVCPSLTRTSSLPMETEEEWRKRKELQSLRRMEAKRKRSEKQKQFRAGKDSVRASLEGPNCEDHHHPHKRGEDDQKGSIVGCTTALKQQQQHVGVNGVAIAPPFGLSSWAAALVRGMDASGNGKVNVNVLAAAAALRGCAPPSSQGSMGSQGSSSSGISEFESRSAQGLSNCTEARSPSSVQSMPEQQLLEQKPNIVSRSITGQKSGTPAVARAEFENQSKKPKVLENGIRETGMKVMEEMPCVSTKGDGPNGKRIEGFLYRYRKGEEVRIVCVCHGNFLTPAEFVKHAGGGDVAHPLRHIVVNPSPSFLS